MDSEILKYWDKARIESSVDVKLDTSASVAQGSEGFEDRRIPLKDLKLNYLKLMN